MTLKKLINTVLFEEIKSQIVAYALRSAVLHNNGLSPAVLAKEIIAKQTSPENFDSKNNPILEPSLNQNNFVEEILNKAEMSNNSLAIKIAELVKDELFGLNATKNFGKKL